MKERKGREKRGRKVRETEFGIALPGMTEREKQRREGKRREE